MTDIQPQITKWYFKSSWIIIIFLSVGPLVLPLIWFNPRFSRRTKVIVTVAVVVLSYFMTMMVINSLSSLKQYYEIISQNI